VKPTPSHVQVGVVLAAAALLFAASVPFWLGSDGPKRQIGKKPVLGYIQQATATALARDGRDDEEAGPDMPFRSNDTLRTLGPGGFAILGFHDGTKLALAGDTVVTCDGQKTVRVRQGDVEADVAPQSPGRPMRILTPSAEIRVVGTRLALSADADATRLGVMRGRVVMTRLSDGRSVEVREGYHSIASARSELTAEPIPSVPDTWSEDFERGLPEDWQSGQWVTIDLPPENAHGAVRAARRPMPDGRRDELYTVTTHKAWTSGLFRIEQDTFLNFTYRLQRPGWFHVFLSVRPGDLNRPHYGNYEYQDKSSWTVPPGQWRTVSVPLSKFRKVTRPRFEDAPAIPPRIGDVAYVVIFSSHKHDRGLVIDRMWVTRGRPAD